MRMRLYAPSGAFFVVFITAQTYLQESIDPILRNATLGEANTLGDIRIGFRD